MNGCGCLLLVVAAIAFIAFIVYASTDPGPPVESVALVLVLARIIGGALGVPGAKRAG